MNGPGVMVRRVAWAGQNRRREARRTIKCPDGAAGQATPFKRSQRTLPIARACATSSRPNRCSALSLRGNVGGGVLRQGIMAPNRRVALTISAPIVAAVGGAGGSGAKDGNEGGVYRRGAVTLGGGFSFAGSTAGSGTPAGNGAALFGCDFLCSGRRAVWRGARRRAGVRARRQSDCC